MNKNLLESKMIGSEFKEILLPPETENICSVKLSQTAHGYTKPPPGIVQADREDEN
jgi:hypothetical protein